MPVITEIHKHPNTGLVTTTYGDDSQVIVDADGKEVAPDDPRIHTDMGLVGEMTVPEKLEILPAEGETVVYKEPTGVETKPEDIDPANVSEVNPNDTDGDGVPATLVVPESGNLPEGDYEVKPLDELPDDKKFEGQ